MKSIRNTPIEGRTVIFYGAGENVRDNFDFFLSFSTAPVCFADADKSKHHTKLFDLEILPLSEAIQLYPNYDILITISDERIKEVADYLAQNGIPEDRIFFTPNLEYRKGCVYLEENAWITFGGTRMKVVSECFGDLVIERTGNFEKDVESMEQARLKARQLALSGQISCCDNCFVNMEDYYPERISSADKINVVFESNYIDTVCNARCCYCTAYDERRYILDNDNLKNGSRFIDDWHALTNLYANSSVFVSFANGEMTASPWCSEITQDLKRLEKWDILVPTNGQIYNDDLCLLINERRANIMVSLDAGTHDTFAKIRGIDCFDEVCENIRKYVKNCGNTWRISVKYIMLEGINDNEADFDGFVRLATECQCPVVISNNNFTLPNPMSQNTRDSIMILVDKIKKANLKFAFGRHCFLSSDYRWAQTLKNETP